MNWFRTTKSAQQNICDQQIALTEQERQIFDLLIQTKRNNPSLHSVEMRVAGGWIRDKLLGQESDDIDIALSSVTGADFVSALKSLSGEGIGKTYIVEQNIERSKHLETAGIDLFGQKVEFVNLRSEEYGDSRVPTMKMGTPEQDAERRDLTINGLFYNIETGQVEDFIGGCQDLTTMTLKTPLDPVKTFQDDPLRMLRVLRFYSRFPEAQIDSSVLEALSNPDVQANYSKLAPERAAPEILKMMKGAKPVEATRILFESGLYKQVFQLPEDFLPVTSDQRSTWHQYNLLDHTLAVMDNVNRLSGEEGYDDEKRAMMNLSAMFHDFGKMDPNVRKPHPKREGFYQYLGHENVSSSLAIEIMTRMGFTPTIKKFVASLTGAHMRPHQSELFEDNPKGRKRLGKFVRDLGDYSDESMLLGLADELSKGADRSDEEIQSITEERQKQLQHLRDYKGSFGDRVTKTIIDGNQIRSVVQMTSPELVTSNAFLSLGGYSGPVHYMSFIIDKLLEQQWMGRITTPEQATVFVTGMSKQVLDIWKKQQRSQELGKTMSNYFDLLKSGPK